MNSKLKWTIIKKFALRNIYGFTFKEVVEEFPERNPAYLVAILANMVETGMLYKIAKNSYHIIPLNEDPESYEPDGYRVVKYLMQDKEYYIGYASALRIHGLSFKSKNFKTKNLKSKTSDAVKVVSNEKKPLVVGLNAIEQVVTTTQMKPAIRRIAGTKFQFIHHDKSRFFGFENIWINNLERASVSDMERTIVDVATQPQLCGGIIEVGKGIFQAEGKVDRDRLFNYFARNMNKAARKRFLFLTDLLGLQWSVEHERMLKELGSGINLLDPSAPDQGRSRVKFGLKINVDPYQIGETITGRRTD